ncbi:MAG: CPBP family intramembrane metalloprotease [Chloroflexi bacterium]|nr:CPBP family intramembrane metalloprotease [Chloroflexota bacterium]
MSENLAQMEQVTAGQLGIKKQVGVWQITFLVAIAVAITVTEYIFAYRDVAIGIALSLGLALLIYFLISVLRFNDGVIRCAESFALIPLYVLFTSSLPWFFINQQYLMPAVYSCILGLCLWHIYQKDLSVKEIFGFKQANLLKWSLIALLIGTPTGIIEYLVLRPAPAFPTFEVPYLFRDTVYMLFFVGLGEELLFRGFIQVDLARVFGWKWALFGQAALFAVMHLTWRSVPELGFVFFAGAILGWLYLKTKSLVPSIVMHAWNNVMLVAIGPYIAILQ